MTNIAEAGEALLLRGEHIISILLRSTSPQARMHSPRAHIYDCQPARTRTCRTCRTCTSLSLTPTHIAITSSGSSCRGDGGGIGSSSSSSTSVPGSRRRPFPCRRAPSQPCRRCRSVARYARYATNTTSADATTGGAGAPAMLTPSTMSRAAAAATVDFVTAAAAGRSCMHRAVRYRAPGHTRTRPSRGRGYDQGRHGCAHSAHSRDARRSPPLLRCCLAQGSYQCLYTCGAPLPAEYGPSRHTATTAIVARTWGGLCAKVHKCST